MRFSVSTYISLSVSPVRATLVWLAIFFGFGVTAKTQTAHFNGMTLGAGLNSPSGIAVDGTGNVFAAESSSNAVMEIPYSNGSYGTPVAIGSGFNQPSGVAVDGSGNVFVADYNNGAVKEIPYSGGSYGTPVTIDTSSTIGFPFGVAVDAGGDVFVTNSSGVVNKIPYSGGSYGTPVTVGSGFFLPYGVAVDGSGNVFVADTLNNAVKEIPYSGGIYGAPVVVGSGFSRPFGIGVDGSGNLFFTDSSSNAVQEIPNNGGSYGTPITLSSDFDKPAGLAVDGNGNVFVADSGRGVVEKVGSGSVSFGSLAVNTSSPITLTLMFTIDTVASGSNTLGIPTVVTQGATGLDFIDAGTGTCTTNGTAYIYSAGNTCTVDVTFTPKFAGSRYGGATLIDSSGNVIATAYISGVGLGPQLIYNTGQKTTVATGLDTSSHIALDGNGNLFISENHNNQVVEVPWSGSGYGTPTVVGTGFNRPLGMTLDGSGNMFIADANNNRVLKMPRLGTGYGAGTTVGSFGQPYGVAVDGKGNVYVADHYTSQVSKVPWTGSGYGAQILLGTFSQPEDLAVDSSGNVFVLDFGASALFEIPWTGNGYGATIQIPTSMSYPLEMKIDGNQNIYIVTGEPRVLKLTWTGSGYGAQTALAFSGISDPSSIAVAYNGNIFVFDQSKNQLLKFDYADASPLSFSTQNDGTSSAAQSFQIKNIGNAPLTAVAPGLSIADNFVRVTGSGTPADCTATFSLAPNTSCNVSVEFAPVAPADGTVNGSVLLTDNNLNASPSVVQSVSLNGSAVDAPPTVSGISPTEGPAAGGTPVTITGLNLTGATAVSFGGTPATILTNTSTEITVTTPVGTATSTVDVTVTTPGGTSVTSAADQYTYVNAPLTLGSGFNQPYGVVVDGSGNVFVGDTGNGLVKEIHVADGSVSTFSNVFHGFEGDIPFVSPEGLAIESNGDILVADAGSDQQLAWEINPSTGTVGAQVINTTASAIATDNAGDIFVNYTTFPLVRELSQGYIISNAWPGFDSVIWSNAIISGVAADSTGNIYLTSAAQTQILKVNVATQAMTLIGSGLNAPQAVAIDGEGNLYVADTGSNSVKMVLPTDGTVFTLASGFNQPRGVAFDGHKNVYVADTGNNAIKEIVSPLVVGAVIPACGPSAGNNSVTIEGAFFTGVPTVNFGGVPAISVVLNSDTSITAVVPPGVDGTVDIRVTTASGTSAAGTADHYTYGLCPTVTNVSPSQGPLAAGTPVTISGTNLTGTTTVRFGGNAATNVAVVSATEVTALAPAGSAGTVDVIASRGNITSPISAADHYTYVVAPTVTGVLPNQGPVSGGILVTITGTGFTGATAVSFGATALTSFTVVGDTQITAISPVGSAGVVDVIVTTAGGPSAISAADQYIYIAAPVVTEVSPNAGPVAGGTSVTITGTDFTNAMAVNFGSSAATAITSVSSTQIVATSPAGTAGSSVDITVTAPGGTSAISAADQFSYQNVQTITCPQPVTPALAGTSVTLMATASSGLGVSYSVVSGPATVSGSTLTYTGIGTVVVEADQAGSSSYQAAVPVQHTVVVTLSGNVGIASPTLTATVTITAAGTLGTINVLTQGAAIQDYKYVSGSTDPNACRTRAAYAVNASCTVTYTFTPSRPGQRPGAVSLTDSATPAGVMGTAFLSGTGNGPLVTFPGSTALSTVGSGFSSPSGIAVDGSGDVFVADRNHNAVREIVAVDGVVTSSSTVITVGSGFQQPYGLAVDGSGDVFVGDAGNGAVKEIVAVNGVVTSSSTVVSVGGSFGSVAGIALDGSGDVFVVEPFNSDVKEIIAVDGVMTSSSTVVTVSSGFSGPLGVAVDASGNVFVADGGHNAVKMIVAVNGIVTSSSTVVTVGSGFVAPAGLAVDGGGNVFVADENQGGAREIVAVNGVVNSSSRVVTMGGGLSGAFGIALDGSGHIFVAEPNSNLAQELDLTTAPTLAFASTAVGNTSAAQAATLQNVGNVALIFTALGTSSANFTLDATTTTCSTLSSLDGSATCTVGATATPQSVGSSLTGTFDITDNNLYASSGATQTVPLSGSAYLLPTATQSVASTMLTAGQAATPFVPVTGGAGSGTLSYSVLPLLPPGLNYSSSTGTVSGTPSTASATATYTVTVTDSSSNTATATFSLTVNSGVMATQTIASAALTQNHATASFTPVTGSGGTGTLSYGVSPSLPVSLSFSPSTGAITGTPTTTSAATTYTVTVTDANGATATASFSLTVHGAVTATQVVASTALTLNHAATSFIPVTGGGGAGSLSYSVSPGLPAGLSFSSSTGMVSGTPTIGSGATNYTVTVTDANGAAATATFSLTVNGAVLATVAVASTTLTADQAATAFAPVTGSGGTGGLSYSVAPSLPAGLSFSTSTGAIAGTPTVNSSATIYTVTITDVNGASASASFSLTISTEAPVIVFSVGAHKYGDAVFTVNATSNSSGSFTYAVVSGPATIAGDTVSLTGAGPVTLSASEAAAGKYASGSVQASFDVAQATLTLTANNATRVYGAANPSFSGTVAGQQYADTFMESFSTSATALSPVSSYAIVPSASGAALGNYAVIAVDGSLAVTQAPTITGLTVSSATINPNQSVTLDVQVASTTSGVPTGSVTLSDNGVAFQTVVLSGGNTSYTTTLAPGTAHLISATYSGDSNFLASSTAGSGVTVTVAPLDFSFTDAGTAALTVSPGTAAAYSFSVSPNFGVYLAPISFSVAGLPPGAKASFTPSTIPVSGGAQTVTMTVQTSASLVRNGTPRNRFGRGVAPVVLALLFLPFLGSRKPRAKTGGRFLPVVVLLAGLAAAGSLSGCADDGFLLDKPQTYTLTVTATSGSLQHTSTVTLIVQ